ncbi:thioredoxin [Aeropyrum pernix]|uniref:Thioredoxin n=1 Tax=Aeropyrum pernix TaxID=56636 RepID=A0A401H808_AERPX|nr:thioredoxin family protein [Aeropyrum pernix]GBF08607.1 thioredoxin [Aeropyrum pernix]
MNVRLLVGVFLGLVMVASTFVVVFQGFGLTAPQGGGSSPSGGGEEGGLEEPQGLFPTVTYTLPLAGGDRLVYESTSTSPSGTNVATNAVSIVEPGWPESSVEVQLLEAGDPVVTSTPEKGVLTTTLLALPKQYLGMQEIVIPVYIPPGRSGLCMRLTLEAGEAGGYTYRGYANVGDYTIAVKAVYRGDGILEAFEAGIVGGGLSIRYTQSLVEASVSGSDTMVSGEWECTADGFSSNLSYVKEGLAVLEDGRLTYITPEEFRQLLQGDAILAVYSKTCPHCHRDWPQLIQASKEVDVPIVMFIWGSLIGERELSAARLEMNKAGVEGTPTLVFYKEGRIVDKLVGETPWSLKVEKAREIYGG